ncbi:5'-nucleotidase [Alkalihalobacillus xiaoxiensis]|uniref:5'-nucleotidase n=1 Tax=Shouchella xiaoxiensis TaxID=766895 RepID=A0ABS2SYE5_9BACI|nr:5'-nucleotidase [Shouchella xiaoxiensis]
MKKQVTLYHTNDIHSGFKQWSRIVSHIKNNRSPDMRYIDLGDHADRSNPMTEATAGHANIELLNAAGVDFVTIGNNEGVTFSKEMLERMYGQASFKVVVANLLDVETGKEPKWAVPYLVDTMDNGLRIGYIGFTAAMIYFYEQLGWEVSFSISKLKEMVEFLAPKTDAIVLLSHLGLPKDEMIAREVQGIAAIIGAHTHHALPNGKTVNNTVIAQAGKHGNYLGELTLTFSNNQLYEVKETLLDPALFERDEETFTLLQVLEEQSQIALSEPAVYLSRPLEIDWFHWSESGQELCDALTTWCKEEIGMLNAGVLLERLPAGPVTNGDIHRICPHPINPCIVELNGIELKETIERAQTDEIVQLQLKGFGFRGKVLGLMLFSGIEITAKGIFIQGKPIQAEQSYRLATLDMYTFGFLFPHIAEAANKTYLLPEFLRDVLFAMLKNRN